MLRKKPAGALVSATAHKVEREHRVLAALSTHTHLPVPRALALCADPAVLGTAFYLMTFVAGRIEHDPALPGAAPPRRARCWADAVRTLAALHAVDPAAVGLEAFGRPADFYPRQVATWKTIGAAQAAARDADTGEPVGALPRFDDMVAFFEDRRRQPPDRNGLVHGDYKIDNLVFDEREPRVVGILELVHPTPPQPPSPFTWRGSFHEKDFECKMVC